MSKAQRRPTKRSRSPRLPVEVTEAVEAATDRKAIDLTVLDLRKSSAFTDFFIICTGGSTRQVRAIADAIQERLGRRGTRATLVEGYDQASWVLIDYFDFIVHIFAPTSREFYNLERLWGDAERISDSA